MTDVFEFGICNFTISSPSSAARSASLKYKQISASIGQQTATVPIDKAGCIGYINTFLKSLPKEGYIRYG